MNYLNFIHSKNASNICKLKTKLGIKHLGQKDIYQMLYKSKEWMRVRNKVIIRDNGCDLGIEGREINGPINVHHINPITEKDIVNRSPIVFDMNNLICVSDNTHKAIHYGDEELLMDDYQPRRLFDTCPWKRSD